MRSPFAGTCYRCNLRIEPGDGHFERFGQGWRMQHATCAIEHRGEPDPARAALNHRKLLCRAKTTGKHGQRARQKLARLNADIKMEDF